MHKRSPLAPLAALRARTRGLALPRTVTTAGAVGLLGTALILNLIVFAHTAPIVLNYVGDQAQGLARPSDFVNYYGAARMLLERPESMYQRDAEAALEHALIGRSDIYSQFQNLPQAALWFVPFTWLPFAAAYVVWFGLNLLLLGTAVALLAPSLHGLSRFASWAVWMTLSLALAPLQFALVDGQTSLLGLFGVTLCLLGWERGWRFAPLLGLLLLSPKPQLLVPVGVLALWRSRGTRDALLLVLIELGLLGVAALRVGAPVVARYVDLARDTARTTASGETVLGIVQHMAVGELTPLVSALVSTSVLAVWWSLWRHRLHDDPRRWLQLAVVPVTMVLLAARAFTYELCLWLPVAWLLARYAAARPSDQKHVVALLALTSVAACLDVLTAQAGPPWGALAGTLLLLGILRDYHAYTQVARTGASA